MKIIYVITGLGVGGAERQVVDISDRLLKFGHSIKIIYLTGAALTLPESNNVQVIGLSMEKTPIGFVLGYAKLRKIIKEFEPDVIHSHMVHANLLTRLVRLTCRIPRLVCTAHSSNEGGKLRMIAYRLTDFLADISTNVSAEAVAAFEASGAVMPGRMIPVHNGIDTERFRPANEIRLNMRKIYGVRDNEKIIIAVGRLNVAKDYPNLLHAFANLCQQMDGIKLWIVGDGELRGELKALASNLNINQHVSFWGIHGNVEDWMNAADVFVLSSAWEGFGLVVGEAMACQKVVVATDAGGVKEVLGDCGFLVPTRDANALSGALRKAISLPLHDSNELRIKSRARILSKYSMDNALKNWLKIYKSNGKDTAGVSG